MKNTIIALSLALFLSACNYSNTFDGTFNGAPATMKAYSKNINRYCVNLNLTTKDLSLSAFISAQSVFDPNDMLKPMAFNTKDAQCGSSSDQYMVGTRNTKVLRTSLVSYQEFYGVDFCRYVTYNSYDYQEDIALEFRKKADDSFNGRFVGTGLVASYVDRDHPVSYGPIYFCGRGYPYPYPGPGPWPYPGPYPGPYPRPFPGPYGF
ncbi:MAG: hypothetical protein ACKOA8_00680 [Deltaproteobacteria bacterium]